MADRSRAARRLAVLAAPIYLVPFLLVWLLPIAISLTRPQLIYTNGWDEEVYLSYQGAWATRGRLGNHLSAYGVLAMHRLGLSGAAQNVLFDIVTPLAVFSVAFLAAGRLDRRARLAYACLITFGAVLFNDGNPWHIEHRWNPEVWAIAADTNPPWLRTPNPAMTYVLLSGAIAAWLTTRRWWWLLVPIPLLYANVAVAYVPLIAIVGAHALIRRRYGERRATPWLMGAAALAVVLAAGIGLWIVVPSLISADPTIVGSRFDTACSAPLLSVTGFVSAGLVAVVALAGALTRRQPDAPLFGALMGIAAVQVLIANQQVFSGRCLDPRGLQDAAGSMLAAVATVLAFEIVRRLLEPRGRWVRGGAAAGRTALVLTVIGFLATSQGFSFETGQFRLLINTTQTDEDVARFIKDPLHAIFLNETIAPRMTLAAPRVLAPLLTHHYALYGFTFQPEIALRLHEEAIAFVNGPLQSDPRAKPWLTELAKRVDRYQSSRATWPPDLARLSVDRALPEERVVPAGAFYAVDSAGSIWLTWPDWSKPAWRERFRFVGQCARRSGPRRGTSPPAGSGAGIR